MNEHRSARLWVGFAVVAAIALLAVGPTLYRQWGGSRAPRPNHDDAADAPRSDESAARTVGRKLGSSPMDGPLGDPSKDDGVGMPAAEQGGARELVAKSYQAALHSPHRLEWAPEEIIPSNTVFDLCDKVQAAEAGLTSYQLENARNQAAVDCRIS